LEKSSLPPCGTVKEAVRPRTRVASVRVEQRGEGAHSRFPGVVSCAAMNKSSLPTWDGEEAARGRARE